MGAGDLVLFTYFCIVLRSNDEVCVKRARKSSTFVRLVFAAICADM
jgi:hypothetical protein